MSDTIERPAGFDPDDADYRAGRSDAYTPRQGEIDDIRAGVTRDAEGNAVRGSYADHAVHEMGNVADVMRGYSASPTREDQRPAFERKSYARKAVPFNQIMELWAAHEGGTLKRITQRHNEGEEGYGEDEARQAWEWVARTKGWGPVVHEVMRHLELHQKTWAQWPRAHVERMTPYPHCPWPPSCVPLELAGLHWRPFYRLLRIRYRRDPFTIFAQEAQMA